MGISSISPYAKKIGTIKRSYDVAVDVTNMPYYGKVLRDEMYKSRPKDETARFHSYVTEHLDGNEYGVALNSVRVKKGEKMGTVLLQICQKIIRGRIRPSRTP